MAHCATNKAPKAPANIRDQCSVVVAVLTYLTMSIPYVEHLLFVFPELLLVLLAGTLLMGRYSGFRLLELRRFKALVPS